MDKSDLNHITKEYSEMREKDKTVGEIYEPIEIEEPKIILPKSEAKQEINRDFQIPVQKVPAALRKLMDSAKIVEYNHV